MAAVIVDSDFGAQENEIWHSFHFFSICYEVMGLDAMIQFDCWTLNHLFQSPVSPTSRGSLVPLHFLPLKWYHLLSEVVDISCCNLNSILWVIQPAFHMIYSAYNLNKQGENIQPWSIPFPILNQPAIPLFHVLFYCCFLTCMQISQEAAKLVFKTNSL